MNYTNTSTVLVLEITDDTRKFKISECKCSSIDWGDGTIDNKTSHTYSENGTYTVEIKDNTELKVNNYPHKNDNIVNILQLSGIIDKCFFMFASCMGLVDIKITAPKLKISNGYNFMFEYCTNLKHIEIVFPDGNVKRNEYIFSNCNKLETVKLEFGKGFEYYSYLFNSCTNLVTVDLIFGEDTNRCNNLFEESITNLKNVNILFKSIPKNMIRIFGMFDFSHITPNFSFDMDKITPDEAHEFLEKYFTEWN